MSNKKAQETPTNLQNLVDQEYQQKQAQLSTPKYQPNQTLNFVKEADTFRMQVQLKQGKLHILLKDHVDHISYESQYTQKNKGEQIHKKVDLIDIYQSLSEFSQIGSQNQTYENTKETKIKFDKYKFGDTIQFMQSPCYQIHKNGLINVFVVLFNKRTKNQLVYNSTLKLIKKQSMSETEVLIRRFQVQKFDIREQYQGQIQKLKKKIQQLQQKLLKQQQKSANRKIVERWDKFS